MMRSAALVSTLLLCAGCVSAPRAVEAHEQKKVVCFFGGGAWRYERMTHFIPGFLAFDGDGTLAEWDLREVAREAHAAGAKVIVSFDGEHWQENFLPMSENEDGSRDRFIANILQYCLDNGIDGVDYDWEIGGGFNARQQKLYSDLVIETKQAFQPHGLTVSIDAYFRDELNAEGIAAVDWLQLMAYEDMDEMRSMVEYWKVRGVPDEKIVIGMAVGWGDEGEGMDHALARAKVNFCLEGKHAGVMLFRTDLDSQDERSMLLMVHEAFRDPSP